ncbi:MAG TPA: elongation factor G [Aggregatilineales bacterium]|nr:elongation factor G [Anaerolineales bacterium]HRE49218.1 elongation factor G [Aggregatilineales bacterium]
MKEYTTEFIRNVALAGHQGSGKTSLIEALLFTTGAATRMGSITEGNTVSDYDDDEKARQLSLNTSIIPIEFDNHKINLMDTPGYTDFQGEMKNAIRVCDCVVVAVDAVSGPQVGTELAWQFADEFNQPLIVVINKINRENASYERTVEALRVRFPDYKFIPVILPIGEGPEFQGVINVLTQKAYYGIGKDRTDPPADMVAGIEEAHKNLVEAAAEATDELINKYFETQELTFEEIRDGMRLAARDANLKTVPVFVAAGAANSGTYPLLEAMLVYVSPPSQRRVSLTKEGENPVDFLMPPQGDDGPLAAFVFKTAYDKFVGTLSYFRIFSGKMESGVTYFNAERGREERFTQLLVLRGKEQIPVSVLHAGDIGAVAKLSETQTSDTICRREKPYRIRKPIYPAPVYSVALEPKTQQDGTKMGAILTQLTHADPTLQWRQAADTRQVVLSGMGDIHIAVTLSRAERLGCNLSASIPKVPYRETVMKTGNGHYRHKKQTGGAGQFGEVFLRVQPQESGAGFSYENETVGGSIAHSFIPSIEKGIRQVLETGLLGGYPIVDVAVAVTDGKMHPVDSKDVAFQIAGRGAFKEAFMQASPVLLEPIMELRVIVPEESMGDVIGDLSTRRGRVQGMDTEKGRSIVTAEVPLAEIQRYSNDLRSMTGGRGIYTAAFLRYESVPTNVAQPIINAHKPHADEEE